MAFAARPWFAATPLILLCIFLIIEPPSNVRAPRWGLALAYALLVLLHIVSALLVGAIAGFILAFHGLGRFRRQPLRLLSTAAALAIGLGLTAFYWLPGVMNTDLILSQYWHMDEWRKSTAFPIISNALGFPTRWWSWQYPIPMIYAAFLLVIWILGRVTRHQFTYLQRGLMLAGGAALFLSSEYAYPVYKLFLPLTRIQHPYRFISPAAICVTVALSMFCWRTLETHSQKAHRFLAGGVLFLFALTQLVLVYVWARGDEVPNPQRMRNLESSAEYLPASARTIRGDWLTWARGNGFAADCERLGVTVLSTSRDNHLQVWDIHAPGSLDLRLPVFQFPGWRLSVDGGVVESRTDPATGVIVVPLHPGVQHVELQWIRSRIWLTREGAMITASTLIVLLIWVLYAKRMRA
jgi:hypothetical protein